MIWKTVMETVSNIVSPMTQLIDDVHTSTEEKDTLRNAMQALKNEVALKHMDLQSEKLAVEAELMKAQSAIITAEAQSDSMLAKTWRPVTMLIFVGIIVLHSVGLITLEPSFADQFMLLVQIGLGGYVAGRSLEKAVPMVGTILKK